jgi:hypothetical protein
MKDLLTWTVQYRNTSQGIILLGEPAFNTSTFTFLSEALKSLY